MGVDIDPAVLSAGAAASAHAYAQARLHIDEETYTTIGGYMLGRLGRRARVDDAIDVEGRKMRVEALDGLRVARVLLSTAKPSVGAQEPERVRDDDH